MEIFLVSAEFTAKSRDNQQKKTYAYNKLYKYYFYIIIQMQFMIQKSWKSNFYSIMKITIPER